MVRVRRSSGAASAGPASASSTAASSAGVALQNWSGDQPSAAPAKPASRAAALANSATALQYLREQALEDRRRPRQPLLGQSSADPLARQPFRPVVYAMPE